MACIQKRPAVAAAFNGQYPVLTFADGYFGSMARRRLFLFSAFSSSVSLKL